MCRIILGRCANYLLMDRPNVLKIFIHAPIEAREARVASYSLAWSPREVSRHIRVEDKRRSAYYHYYTGEEWRDVAAYDLSLDSEALGEEGCVEMIKKALPLFCKRPKTANAPVLKARGHGFAVSDVPPSGLPGEEPPALWRGVPCPGGEAV